MNIQKNVRLNYLYRDASNYKKWGAIIFSNLAGLSLEMIEEELTACFEEQIYFAASQVDIPEVFLFINDRGGRVCLDSLKQFLSGKLLCLMPLPAAAVV